MRYTLTFKNGTALTFDKVSKLGRQEGSNDLVVTDKHDTNAPHISRHHAVLTPAGDGVMVRDLGSHNGTYINGARIKGEGLACLGDTITFGGSVRVKLEAEVQVSCHEHTMMGAA